MFTSILNHALCVAALSLIISVPSRAQTVEVETGVFCDTQQQMERYVALYNGDTQAALNAVNKEVNDPTACVYGTTGLSPVSGAQMSYGCSFSTPSALRRTAQ